MLPTFKNPFLPKERLSVSELQHMKSLETVLIRIKLFPEDFRK
jgi:hypothetical protein